MSDIFRFVAFDQFSFWAGFLGGILVLWLLRKLFPSVQEEIKTIRGRLRELRTRNVSRLEDLFLLDTLKQAQTLHIASPLFSLDEIFIEPRLLEPPPPVEALTEDHISDIVSQTLPYLPDWPQLAAWYSGKTMSLAQALSKGADLVIMGHPGCGKTVALACLACQLARRDPKVEHLTDLLPVFLHISDLLPLEKFTNSPLEHIQASVRTYVTSLRETQLENLISEAYQNQKILLLLDGLDEASPALYDEALAFLQATRAEHPSIRIVTTASPEDFHGLTELGLIPVPLAAWGPLENEKFIRMWSKQWARFINSPDSENTQSTDPRLLITWLADGNQFNTPLETTLKVWAGFCGDSLGSSSSEIIEAYLRRITHNRPKVRQALEELALQLIAKQQIASSPRELRGWESLLPSNKPNGGEAGSFLSNRRMNKRSLKSLPGVFPELQEYGLLVERLDGRLAFSHPVITGYLAASALSQSPVIHFLSNQPGWTGKWLSSIYLAGLGDVSAEAIEYLNKTGDPLQKSLLTVGRWLRMTPRGPAWRTRTMRALANLLQENGLATGLRFRLMAVLLNSGDQDTAVLLRQLLNSPQAELRNLAALGLGLLRDQPSTQALTDALNDSNLSVSRAACLALVSIGTKPALEAMASALLHGTEDLRRSVAEALALHPAEGHPMLQEGSEMEDLLVRRAVVYGLAHLNTPSTKQILGRLAVDDKQWIVRAAATHALEQITFPDPGLPAPLLPLNETSWLITFASYRGVGIPPGKPAEDLLIKVLLEGDLQQKLAALEYLRYSTYPATFPILSDLLANSDGKVKDAAYETLWFNSAANSLSY